VKFKGGDAELECVVIKEDGAWRIVAINVESEALLNAAQKAKSAPAAGSTWNRGPAEDEAAVLAEAEEILRLLDSEYPATAWDRASKVFQDAMPKARFTARLERMHEKSGHLQGRKLQGIGFMFDRPGASPPGNYAVADYVSTYSQVTLDERLGFYQVEGRWLFSGYQWTERKSK
jgi:hypothetical protein